MKAKKLKEKVNTLLIEWVRDIVAEEEQEQVTKNNVQDLLPKK